MFLVLSHILALFYLLRLFEEFYSVTFLKVFACIGNPHVMESMQTSKPEIRHGLKVMKPDTFATTAMLCPAAENQCVCPLENGRALCRVVNVVSALLVMQIKSGKFKASTFMFGLIHLIHCCCNTVTISIRKL